MAPSISDDWANSRQRVSGLPQSERTVAEWNALVLENVNLTFNKGKVNEYQALAGTNLVVRRGEFFCLLGPSGCGKSTILNLVAGFVRPDSGEIRMGTRRIRDAGTDRVVLFQDASNALFPWLRAQQNVEFGLTLQGVPHAEAARRALQCLDLVGLKNHALTISLRAFGRYEAAVSTRARTGGRAASVADG